MTEEQVKKGSQILNQIKNCKEELEKMKTYKGNKWCITYGQDSTNNQAVQFKGAAFDKIFNTMISEKENEIKELQVDLEKI